MLARLATLAVLAACAPSHDATTPEARSVLFEDFRRGATDLSCTVACSWAWVTNRDEMHRLDEAGDWRSLAVLVASVGYEKDLGYYYLGRAASGLGLSEPAVRYYRQSYALATGLASGPHCRAIEGDCAGVDLLAVLPAKLQPQPVTGASGQAPKTRQVAGAAKPRKDPSWTRIACEDGHRFAMKFTSGDAATAQVKIDDSDQVIMYENSGGASGMSYIGPPGYLITEWHNQWSYMHDKSGTNIEVRCQEL